MTSDSIQLPPWSVCLSPRPFDATEAVREPLDVLREAGSLLVTDKPAVHATDNDEEAIEAACYGDRFKKPPVDQIGEDRTVGAC